MPPAATPPENSSETVAPKNIPQSDLVLRQVKDLLRDNKVTPEMLDEMGFKSKGELEQFVDKFDKAPKAAPGEGREIEVKPGQPQATAPDTKLPDLNPRSRVSSKAGRDRGSLPQDNIRNNNEGVRFVPPPELRAGFEAFQSTLNRSKSLNPGARKAGGSGGK